MIKKILVSSAVILAIPIATLVLLVLFPSWSYAHSTERGAVTVYSNAEMQEVDWQVIEKGLEIIRTSELYDEDFRFDLCLDEGAAYPRIMERIMGPAFAYGYYNKVVLASSADFRRNEADWNGRRWQLDEVIAHEMIHCLQYNAYGFETLNTPFWKHEGYCELVAGRLRSDHDLMASMEVLVKQEARDDHHEWAWIQRENGLGLPYSYLKAKVLVQYLREVEDLSYDEILTDERTQETTEYQLRDWYQSARPSQKAKN